jgi:hypothetical protein
MKVRGRSRSACYLILVSPAPSPTAAAVIAGLLVCGGCGGAPTPRDRVDPEVVVVRPGDVRFVGMCDASGAVPLGGARFAVADDEDNVLRVYDADRGGKPIASIDVSTAILPERAAVAPGEETDLEAATRVGDVAFWIASHGRRKSGKPAPARLRFFATTAPADGVSLEVVATTDALLQAMIDEPRHAELGLAAASALAPTAPGGLNIEGLSRREAGGVWIALRNPTVGGNAVVLALENPLEHIRGEPARFADPVLLDLDGLGVRAMTSWRGRHVIVAGDAVHASRSRLFVWDLHDEPREITSVDLTQFNAEAFVSRDDRDQIMLLSDDGSVRVPDGRNKKGKPCKRQHDPARKSFHGRLVAIPDAIPD